MKLFVALLLFSLPALGQEGRVWKIGVFAGTAAMQPIANDFMKGMAELGYVEGQNVQYLQRYGDGTNDGSLKVARELVAAKVDLIWTPGTQAAVAARQVTTTVPIVFSQVSDPVGSGLVQSLGRPGANATGLTNMNVETWAKRVELLEEILPKLRRVGVLHNPSDMASVAQLAVAESSLRARGKEVMVVQFKSMDDVPAAFAGLAGWRADTVVMLESPLVIRNRKTLIALATKHRWPTINSWSGFAESGGVLSYGSSWSDAARRSAGHVHKILKGGNPAALPVERPVKFDLVANVQAAKAVGVTIPKHILVLADRVIE